MSISSRATKDSLQAKLDRSIVGSQSVPVDSRLSRARIERGTTTWVCSSLCWPDIRSSLILGCSRRAPDGRNDVETRCYVAKKRYLASTFPHVCRDTPFSPYCRHGNSVARLRLLGRKMHVDGRGHACLKSIHPAGNVCSVGNKFRATSRLARVLLATT